MTDLHHKQYREYNELKIKKGHKMSKKVTIYTSNTCGQCKMVKRVLTMKGHQYDEVNIDESPERHQEIMQLSGQIRVPVTVVKDDISSDQTVIVGYNVGQLMPALV